MQRTPLHDRHVAQGARMVPFAGYEMPVQYRDGILAEHRHTRTLAGLFDVSHMGQLRVTGDDPAVAFERVVPGDIRALAPGEMRYSLLTNDRGGILDDLIITRLGDGLAVVVNAACKDDDIAHIRVGLDGRAKVEHQADRALLALQGPVAARVMGRLAPEAEALNFMTAKAIAVAGIDCLVSRSGYTGEDGFEIALAADHAPALFDRLIGEAEVAPIGLGARDSLRLEAGLCLSGHDFDATTTPIEAGLGWAIGKRRREAGDFPGAAEILRQRADGPPRRRVGIRLAGRAPGRAGAEIVDGDGRVVGRVTSGGFGPTVGGPIAMGYVPPRLAAVGSDIELRVRGRDLAAKVVGLPFVPHRYYRGS